MVGPSAPIALQFKGSMEEISAGKLVQLLPDWSLPEQPMALIYHRDRYRPQRLTKFIDFVKSVFRSQLA